MASQYGRTRANVHPVDPAHAGLPARGARDRARRRREARLLRPAAGRLPPRPAGVLALVREPPAPRDRARDGHRAEAAAARRAGRGDEPRRDARDHGADRRAARPRRLHDPRHRARHARRRGNLRPRRRARPRREDRRGLVRRRSRRTRASSRRTSGSRRHERAPRARADRHVLRRDPHPREPQPARRARASSCACSAATPPASRRR